MTEVTRRVFLERVGAGALSGAAVAGLPARHAPAFGAEAPRPRTVSWSPPPVLGNPNILFILVDQMRFPLWVTSSQLTTLNQQYLPNIFGRLRNNSYNFQQYYVAATTCTASRSTLLTGLCGFYTHDSRTIYDQRNSGTIMVTRLCESTIAHYEEALGDWEPSPSGLIATELDPPLSQAQSAARQSYFDAAAGAGRCTAG